MISGRTLGEGLLGRVETLNYKTVRYPGHCEIVRLLVRDLRLACRRDVLKDVLETASAVVVLSAKGDELAAAALARVRNLLAEPADPLADPWLAQRLRSFLATDPVLIAVKGWAREGRGRRSTG